MVHSYTRLFSQLLLPWDNKQDRTGHVFTPMAGLAGRQTCPNISIAHRRLSACTCLLALVLVCTQCLPSHFLLTWAVPVPLCVTCLCTVVATAPVLSPHYAFPIPSCFLRHGSSACGMLLLLYSSSPTSLSHTLLCLPQQCVLWAVGEHACLHLPSCERVLEPRQ